MDDSPEPFDREAFLATWPRDFTEAEWAEIERSPIHDDGTPPPGSVLIEDRDGNVRVVRVPEEFGGSIGYLGASSEPRDMQ
jgi:hypothetical protein